MKEHLNRVFLQDAEVLPEENDEGSIEYKWKLVNIDDERFEHLVSQMKYRVSQGQGECIYEIGVADNGFPKGLPETEFRESLETLGRMADRLQCDVSIVCEKVVCTDPELKCAEVMVRKFGLDDFVDVRVVICGHVGAGKSTLVGVLTGGILDSGRGSARQKVFNHLHEVETGLTSSISQQILGFDSRGNVVNYNNHRLGHVTAEQIAELSSKVCTLYDLAGHQKYLKTTITGFTGSAPDYACLVIRADKGIQQMTKEHLGLICSLNIPFFCVLTCIEACNSSQVKSVIKSIGKLLKLPGVRKQIHRVADDDDVMVAAKVLKDGNPVPIFAVSNVTGENLDQLRTFLNLLPVRREWEELAKLPMEISVDNAFQIKGVGLVVTGIVEQGWVCYGDSGLMGPDMDGNFLQVKMETIQVKRVNVKKVDAGTHASFAITALDGNEISSSQFRRGTVILEMPKYPAPSKPLALPKAWWRFEADVTVLFTEAPIQQNFQPVIHCRMIRQKGRLFLGECSQLTTGQKACIQMEFQFFPEFIKEGLHFVFMDGVTKGIGTITRLIQVDAPLERPRSNPGRSRPRSSGCRVGYSGEQKYHDKAGRPRFWSGNERRSPTTFDSIMPSIESESSGFQFAGFISNDEPPPSTDEFNLWQ